MPTPPALDSEHTLADQRRDLMLHQILPPLAVEARRKPPGASWRHRHASALGTRDSHARPNEL
jgi:hypothetical protein